MLDRHQASAELAKVCSLTQELPASVVGAVGATSSPQGWWPVMCQAGDSARMGWGLWTIAGVAGQCETLDVMSRHVITGRRVCGSSFGGVKGRDQVPGLVRLYRDGTIDINAHIWHRLTPDEVNKGFKLTERPDGVPQCDHVVTGRRETRVFA